LGGRKGIQPVKTEWVICLERGAYGPADASAIPSSLGPVKSRMVNTFLVPAYPGCPGKKAVKWI